jgi:hypothetical protein
MALMHARLAQSVERTTLNRVVVGSIPTSGAFFLNFFANIHSLHAAVYGMMSLLL